MTLSDMAREIERRRPDTLPKSMKIKQSPPKLFQRAPILSGEGTQQQVGGRYDKLEDDLAAAILQASMVMATGAMRVDKNLGKHLQPSWLVDNDLLRCSWFDDADHGNCPTRSLFAAFCAAFPEAKP